MIRIDSMRLQLPAGFEGRADGIARLVGESLTQRAPERSVQVKSASVGPVNVERQASDRQIAAMIAASIRREVGV
ncbi:MAG: hypothetical protein GY715_04045 [Planctomycetes bacterium]|nr:hypothetical protein [Planctomycetota bacterium]